MITNSKANMLAKKRAAVVDAFLLWNYQRIDPEKKIQIERDMIPKHITSTMRLEGEQITEQEVRKFLGLQ